MAISQENRYKNGINVTFIVPQTWFLAFHTYNGENYLKFDTNDSIGTFLLTLEGQILTHKDSKDINFLRQLIQNQAKISLLLPSRLAFEPSTIEIEK